MRSLYSIKHQMVLIADEMHASILPLLQDVGYTPDYQPNISRKEILASLADYHGLIIRSKTVIDAELIEHGKNLQFIGRAGAGLDQIDLEAIKNKGIQIFHAGEGNRQAVAEHALGMLLGLFNNLLWADAEVRNGIWKREQNRGIELAGKTVGIIGYGNNGRATAKCLNGFGCKVLAFDKYLNDYGDTYAEAAEMNKIFEETDILSLHIPLNKETRFLVDSNFINRFRNPIFLTNVARGEIVSLTDLVEALKSGKILGACLDVLENEKLNKLTNSQQIAFDYLTQARNVILSPHVAGWTHESYRKINEVLIQKIRNRQK